MACGTKDTRDEANGHYSHCPQVTDECRAPDLQGLVG